MGCFEFVFQIVAIVIDVFMLVMTITTLALGPSLAIGFRFVFILVLSVLSILSNIWAPSLFKYFGFLFKYWGHGAIYCIGGFLLWGPEAAGYSAGVILWIAAGVFIGASFFIKQVRKPFIGGGEYGVTGKEYFSS